MLKKTSRGFTLIELLVVIAIIGILASVVLASLNNARNKGYDGKVKAQIASARSYAEIFYDNQTPKDYGLPTADCAAEMFADTVSGLALYTDPVNYPVGTTIMCVSDGLAFAIAAEFTDDSEWCVDSSGFVGAIQVDDPLTIVDTDSTCGLMDAR